VKRLFRRPLIHERRVQLLALGAGLPAVLVSMIILITGGYSDKVQWTLGVIIVGFWLGFASAVRERVASPLRTLANLLEAMREGDYSIRARGARADDAMGEVMQQVNAMGTTLRAQRLGALEATTLLRKVMEEIDVAVFAFDSEHRLRLVNRAGEKLLGQPVQRVLTMSASEIGLAEFLDGEPDRTVQRTFSGGAGRWGISRSAFREGGLPHQLLVVTDLTRPLREEELQAWQRLVRVLGHELNNSLTPIKSIAESLGSVMRRNPRADDWEDDMVRGLNIIATRSEGLSRFLGAYARLAKLPRPTFSTVDVDTWVRRVTALETRLRPILEPGPPLVLQGDADQLDQMLINLLRNAVDASMETQGQVYVGWTRASGQLSLYVRDEGHGLASTANLFVPFFTTKPGGSGIGLVLSRQIAEAHGGSLTLKNREGVQGCEASLTLPV
jgi:two-component system, NtrC family, nitrogen regulation sensor histidine kinase NtrY